MWSTCVSGPRATPERMCLPRGACYHAGAAMRRLGKCAGLRRDIVQLFADSRDRHGHRRIWLGLKSSGTTIPEEGSAGSWPRRAWSLGASGRGCAAVPAVAG